MSDDAEEDAMEEIPMTPSPAPVEAKPPPADDDDQRPGVVVRDEEQSADATSTPAAPHEPASPPPAFTEEDLRIMEVERKRTQELYVREAELKRREKAVAVAELASPESLAQMNAERRRVAEDFRLQALAKKMQEANVRAAVEHIAILLSRRGIHRGHRVQGDGVDGTRAAGTTKAVRTGSSRAVEGGGTSRHRGGHTATERSGGIGEEGDGRGDVRARVRAAAERGVGTDLRGERG